MIEMTTTHGDYQGQTIDSIIRREYGDTARAQRYADPNAPRWGQVLRTDQHGTHVLAEIRWVSADVRDVAK